MQLALITTAAHNRPVEHLASPFYRHNEDTGNSDKLTHVQLPNYLLHSFPYVVYAMVHASMCLDYLY